MFDDFFSLYSLSIIVLLIPLFLASSFAVKYARSGLTRLTITVFFLTTMFLAFLVPIEFSSHPKPITMEWYNRELSEANLLWGGLLEDVGIFILLDWGQGPRFYRIGWDVEIAQQMQNAMRDAEQQEGQQGQQSQQGELGEGQNDMMVEQGELGEGQNDMMVEQGQGGQSTSVNGPSRIIVRYPFLTKEDRQSKLGADGNNEGSDGDTERSMTGLFEQTETHAYSMFYAHPQPTDPPKQR